MTDKYYLVTLPKYLTREQQDSLRNSSIKILERMSTGSKFKCKISENKFRCEVSDFDKAIKHELVINIVPYFEEPFITQETKNLEVNEIINFCVTCHQDIDMPIIKTKLEKFNLKMSNECSNWIIIQILYPEQKHLLDEINSYNEVYNIQEYDSRPILCTDYKMRKYYSITFNKFPLSYEDQVSLKDIGINILERMNYDDFRCEVNNIIDAENHELIEKIVPWFEEPYITQKTQNMNSDALVTFDIMLHQLSDLTSMKVKLESFGLKFIFRDDSRKIRIELLYPKQKSLLININECDEVDSIEEFVHPVLF